MNQSYRMKAGTKLVVLTNGTKRNPWSLVKYITDDLLCLEAEDGKQIQCYKSNCVAHNTGHLHEVVVRKYKDMLPLRVDREGRYYYIVPTTVRRNGQMLIPKRHIDILKRYKYIQ